MMQSINNDQFIDLWNYSMCFRLFYEQVITMYDEKEKDAALEKISVAISETFSGKGLFGSCPDPVAVYSRLHPSDEEETSSEEDPLSAADRLLKKLLSLDAADNFPVSTFCYLFDEDSLLTENYEIILKEQFGIDVTDKMRTLPWREAFTIAACLGRLAFVRSLDGVFAGDISFDEEIPFLDGLHEWLETEDYCALDQLDAFFQLVFILLKAFSKLQPAEGDPSCEIFDEYDQLIGRDEARYLITETILPVLPAPYVTATVTEDLLVLFASLNNLSWVDLSVLDTASS